MKKIIVGCFILFMFVMSGCSTNKPDVLTVNNYYFINVTSEDLNEFNYRHKKHPGEAGYNYQERVNSEHRKRRGCIPCELNKEQKPPVLNSK